MKNAEKIMTALSKAFSGHKVEMLYTPNGNFYRIYIDGEYIADFFGEFFENDIENKEIEIKIKAPLKSIKDFIEECEGFGDVTRAVERGYKEWEKESQRNS